LGIFFIAILFCTKFFAFLHQFYFAPIFLQFYTNFLHHNFGFVSTKIFVFLHRIFSLFTPNFLHHKSAFLHHIFCLFTPHFLPFHTKILPSFTPISCTSILHFFTQNFCVVTPKCLRFDTKIFAFYTKIVALYYPNFWYQNFFLHQILKNGLKKGEIWCNKSESIIFYYFIISILDQKFDCCRKLYFSPKFQKIFDYKYRFLSKFS